MNQRISLAVAMLAGVAIFATTALAQMTHQGTPDGKSMPDKTVAALKADKTKTLGEIKQGENGFSQGERGNHATVRE